MKSFAKLNIVKAKYDEEHHQYVPGCIIAHFEIGNIYISNGYTYYTSDGETLTKHREDAPQLFILINPTVEGPTQQEG